MDIDLIGNILHLTLRAGTPLLIVALGELICQKSGVLNLGQEGMMLMGEILVNGIQLHIKIWERILFRSKFSSI